MRLGLVCGQALSVPGTLPAFEAALQVGVGLGLVELPVYADLGLSWSPEHPGSGGVLPAAVHRGWLDITDDPPATGRGRDADAVLRRQELLEVRAGIAGYTELDAGQRQELRTRAGVLEASFTGHFLSWLREHGIEVVVALNLTRPLVAPVTAGLARAASVHYGDGRGGVLYWDDALFTAGFGTGGGTVAEGPNELTPLPGPERHVRWAVASRALVQETTVWPAGGRPAVVPAVAAGAGNGDGAVVAWARVWTDLARLARPSRAGTVGQPVLADLAAS